MFAQEVKDYLSQPMFIFLVVLIGAGFFLRIYSLGYQSLWIDETYSITAAKGILQNFKPVMPSGVSYTRAILNTFLIAASMFFFGINQFAARLPSALFGTLTIPLIFLFSRELFPEEKPPTTAIIASFILTFSMVQIAWSRQARMYQQLQFFLFLSLFLFYKFQKNYELKLGLLTLFSTILATLSHKFGLVLIPIYFIFLSITNLTQLKDSFAKNDNSLFSRIKSKLTFPNFLFLSLSIISIYSLINYTNAFSVLARSGINYLPAYLSYLKTTFPLIAYLAVLGGVISHNKNKKPLLILSLTFLIPLYLVSFHEIRLSFRYVFPFLPILYILTGKTISCLTSKFTAPHQQKNILTFFDSSSLSFKTLLKRKIVRYKTYLTLILMFLFVLSLSPALTFQPQKKTFLEPRAPQPAFKEIYNYLNQNKQANDTLIVSYPEVSLWYNQTPDYWLAFSPGGLSRSSWMTENKTHQARTMTPAILNITQLEKVHENNKRGWIVLDSLALHRLGPNYYNFLKNNTYWLKGPSRPGRSGSINLYHWNQSSLDN